MLTATTEFAVQQEDIKQANAYAERLPIEVIPQILVKAMAGEKATLSGVSDELVSSESFTEADTSIKGLILSKDHIVKIKTYVATGLIYPTEESLVRNFLKFDSTFDEKKHPEIAPKRFSNLFLTIHNHCCLWSDLEADIKKTGTSLNIFGAKFVTTGRDLVTVIDSMPIMERIRKLGKDPNTYSIHLGEDDEEIVGSLLELLDILKDSIAAQQKETHALLERLTSFRNTMDNQIVGETAVMSSCLQKTDMQAEQARLLQRQAELEKEITRMNKDYDKMVGYAFTGAAGLILGPVGIISWAITGGIFGDKAEKIRSSRKASRAELDSINRQLEAATRLISFVSSASAQMGDLSVVIHDAVAGVQNLETLWASVAQYIDDSYKELNSIQESHTLITFSAKMKSAVSSWEQVRDITKELVALFEAAAKEALAVAKEASAKEQKKGA